jgi:hypothetical protein
MKMIDEWEKADTFKIDFKAELKIKENEEY